MSNLFYKIFKKLGLIKSKNNVDNYSNTSNNQNLNSNYSTDNNPNPNKDNFYLNQNKNSSNEIYNNTSNSNNTINKNTLNKDNTSINKDNSSINRNNIDLNNYNLSNNEQKNDALYQTIKTQQKLNYEENIDNSKIYDHVKIDKEKINTIWNIIKIKENTQAEHIITCLPEDRWIDMEELKQRIKLQYNIEYKNEKSLYPYIKTLTDINLIKLNNTGKKRTWKKNIIIIDR